MARARGCPAARSISSRASSSKPAASCGWRPTIAITSSWSSAAASACAIDCPFIPTVAIRATPAARARPTSSATGGSHESRWQCVSITAVASGDGRLGLDPREELAELADLGAALDGAQLRVLQVEPLAPQGAQQALGRAGHERVEQHGHDPEALGERVQNL